MVKGTPTTLKAKTLEMTVHLHKYVHGRSFKKRAPHAIKAIRQLVTKTLKTQDVRLDTKVNQYVWSHGIRNVPVRIRVRCERKPTEDEDNEGFFTLVKLVPVESFANLQSKKIE
eukprot:gnl/Trimastix_PCT/98.p4 GENE.gnl/Trimastix_PCT/98~~gnl/Trimastix_PCT/98.p4  ORF type:complete len:114 (+),score=45.11 gnl/Trimastix_PCT/98:82-423(+)